jgi:hypothetical protein
MTFDQRGWINDIVASSVTGGLAGAIGALILPSPPIMITIAAGGIAGLVTGLLNMPLKWLLERRPPETDGRRGESK